MRNLFKIKIRFSSWEYSWKTGQVKDVFWEKCEKSSENLRKNVIFAYKNAGKM